MAIAEREIGRLHEQEPGPQKELLIIGHTYQPPREILLPTSGKRINAGSHWNEQISQECYKKIFVEGSVPDASVFSFGAPLRDWFLAHDPESFEKIKEHVNSIPDKEYRILGDSYIHAILPLLPEEDQDTLVKIGKEAFRKDIGFEPKGFWLPETAVSQSTLKVLVKNGYEFIVLRDDQLQGVSEESPNPLFITIEENGEKIGEIAALYFTSQLSGSVSFNDWVTFNADFFLEDQKSSGGKVISVGTDTELYGHHKKGRDVFLRHLTNPSTLKMHGFKALDVKKKLAEDSRQYTQINEFTSWSCDHNLGRWRDGCPCDNPSDERMNEKKWLSATLIGHGKDLNNMLNIRDRNWRDGFVQFFLDNREAFYRGGQLKGNDDSLLLAKMAQLTGMTSCAWFFQPAGGVETQISHAMNTEIPELMRRAETALPKAA